MFSLQHCFTATTSPFSLLGECRQSYRRSTLSHNSPQLGAIRTATKRAGGTVHNHGGSAGKRLGLKKFSGKRVVHQQLVQH